MKNLYIVRHGETEWNVTKRMQGRLDSPLTERGRGQAMSAGALLKKLGGVDHLLVSPSGRTTETAHLINSHTQCEISYFDQLMERDCGEWSGLTVEEIERMYPQAWAERESQPYHFQPPGGENMQDMLLRVRELLEELYIADVEDVALITHGVMSRVIVKYYLDLDEPQAAAVQHPNNLVYRLAFSAEEIDVAHYLDGQGPHTGLRKAAEVSVRL